MNATTIETVGFHHSFFRNERDRLYADPKLALFREDFQNSTDAGASRISVNLRDVDGGCEIEFDDNGCGMTEEVLRSVFFKIGATTKDSGSVGGFGRARILTCFSMERYRIETTDCIVEGAGSQFSISTGNPYRRGCKFLAVWGKVKAEQLHNKLIEYLGMSQLDCEVTINGERWTKWLYKNREVRSFDWGKVYANKTSGLKGTVIVRVRGAMMFVRSTNADAQVVLEINPDVSRNVLLANRDSLAYEYRAALDSFLDELAINTRSALREKVSRKTTHVHGGGLLNRCRPKKETEKVHVVEVNGSVSTTAQETMEVKVPAASPDVIRLLSAEKARLMSQHAISGDADVTDTENVSLDGTSICPSLFDVYIDDDITSDDKMRRIIDQYNPKNWVWATAHGKPYRKGADYLKLLMLWQTAIDAAIEAAFKAMPLFDSIRYSVGWVFSDSKRGTDFKTGARCKRIGDEFFFLLNPLDESLHLAYSLRSKTDLKRILALAKHEVAHVFETYHDEDYANTLTEIDAEFDEAEAFRKMRETLNEINAES